MTPDMIEEFITRMLESIRGGSEWEDHAMHWIPGEQEENDEHR
jgi:hypothetical protein